MLLVSWTAVFLIFSFRLRQGACCPNQKERGPVARSNLIPAETSEIFPSLGKSDIAAAHRAALRHLGNTPQGYGGQVGSAQSQGFANLLLRRSLAKNQKSSLHTATSFLSTLRPAIRWLVWERGTVMS